MADDDLDMLQQLLEMAEDDDAVSVSSDGNRPSSIAISDALQNTEAQKRAENVSPNKRARITTTKPLAKGKHKPLRL